MDLTKLYELIEQLKKYRARIDGYYEEHDEEYQTSLEVAISEEKDRLAKEIRAKIDASLPEASIILGELWISFDVNDWPSIHTTDIFAIRHASNKIFLSWGDSYYDY